MNCRMGVFGGLIVLGLTSVFGDPLVVRTNYHALVLYYNPHVWKDGQYLTVKEAYHCRDIDALCRDYITFLKRASGGQINFAVAERFELDEFPPETDLNVTFTPENYDQYRSQGYDIFNTAKADYLPICGDPRFGIVPKVESGQVDSVWIFAPDGTGFWETAMAGRDAYWINGGAYPEVNCSRRFVIYGFGMASHQGVGFMLENTAHMTENILGNRIAWAWPATHTITGWTTMNLTNPSRATVTWRLNDFDYFTVSDSLHWAIRLVSPGHSQAGLSHFPPTSTGNYGWSTPRFDFDASWITSLFRSYGGSWSMADGHLRVTGGGNPKTLVYTDYDQTDDLGDYRVPLVLSDADVEVGVTVTSTNESAHAGLLLRCSRYSTGLNAADGYYVGINPGRCRIELARIRNSYTVLAEEPANLEPNVGYRLVVSIRGPRIEVFLGPGPLPRLIFTNASDCLDGGVGLCSYDADASFSHLCLTPVIPNYAENWRGYPELGSAVRTLSPLEWKGDGQPYEDNDYWFAWWYEHLPKNPGIHEVKDPATGRLLGHALNSWWPYIFDINTFDLPFLANTNIASPPADTLAPAAPSNPRGAPLGRNSSRVEWDEPGDNVGVTRYEVWRDGQFLLGTPMRHFDDANLVPATEYTYLIRARDGSGNLSDPSTPIVLTTSADDTLLLNGGFEWGLDGPIPWRQDAASPTSVFTWEPSGRSGARSVSINTGPNLNDARWLQDVTNLVPNGRYRLSGWVKGESIVLDQGAKVGANLGAFGTSDRSLTLLSGTFDWTHVQTYVHADRNGKLTVACRLGFWSSLAGGKTWFDDLTLEYAPPTCQSLELWGADFWHLGSFPDGLSNTVALAAASTHLLALLSDGSVLAWGDNGNGQIEVPDGLAGVTAIAAGGSHSLAVRTDGTVAAWGYGIDGQLDVPVDLTNAVAVAAGSRFSLALRSDGTVVAWGGNHWGETNVPPGLTNVVAIDAGHEFALALRGDGTVAAWGSLQTGDDQVYPAYVPPGLDQVVAIACGTYHAVALRADGTVVAWGEGAQGQTNVPAGLTRVVGISAGGNHSLALFADGSVIGWGENQFGQVSVPATVTPFAAIDCGFHFSIAVTDGQLPRCTARATTRLMEGDQLELQFPSRRGEACFLQYKDAIEDPSWTLLSGRLALGSNSRFTEVTKPAPQRFYWIRVRP